MWTNIISNLQLQTNNVDFSSTSTAIKTFKKWMKMVSWLHWCCFSISSTHTGRSTKQHINYKVFAMKEFYRYGWTVLYLALYNQPVKMKLCGHLSSLYHGNTVHHVHFMLCLSKTRMQKWTRMQKLHYKQGEMIYFKPGRMDVIHFAVMSRCTF